MYRVDLGLAGDSSDSKALRMDPDEKKSARSKIMLITYYNILV